MKKSSALRTDPFGVLTENRPDAAFAGTVVASEVALADVTCARARFTASRFCASTVSKFVPLTVTAVPGVPIVGENSLMVGASDVPTTKGAPLFAEPLGVVTEITPVVAPVGTVTTRLVVDAEVIDAVVPLNVTVF
jgi:hypothetical protein